MLNRIYDFIYRIFRVSGRTLIKYSSDPRPHSRPYVTGDGFRKLAKFIYDRTENNVDPDKVKEGDLIFVGDSLIKKFLTEIHPQIKTHYVVISHNGDENIDQAIVDLMDDKIIKWYGINILVKDPRLIPLPLGLENKHYYLHGIPFLFNRLRKKKIAKINRIFYGFSVNAKPKERQPALDVLIRHPLAETVAKWMNFKKYLDLLATYKLVASPPGSSVEGHRTWDAMYLGIVPIVKKSVTTDYFKSLGLPLWVIADWQELNKVDEKFLGDKFKELRNNFDESKLFIDYWSDKILNLED